MAQLFGKVGYTSPQTRLTFSVTGAHNRLSGAQTLPLGMLTDPTQSYTWPDYATHHFAAFNATARHRLSAHAVLAGNLYFRRLLSHELDSNTNDAFNIALPVDAANSPGLNAVADSAENAYGAAARLVLHQPGKAMHNRLVLGASA
ncbi:MAG: hypothetical protein P8124_13295, partial [Gammaproteobacteria bacterium]